VVRSNAGQKNLPEEAVPAAYTAACRLMDGMLHDARNPLNALAINLEVLSEKLKGEDGEVPASQDRNLKAMREQIFRVDAILRKFADFIAPRPAPGGEVDLSEISLKALEVVAHDSRKRRVRIRQMVEPQISVRCAEQSGLHLLLVQPLLRGLARTASGGEVELAVMKADGRAVFRVTDAAGPQPEPHPEMAAALETLCQQNGAQFRIQDGLCELSFPQP
jgi:signal transduction histidine kinase